MKILNFLPQWYKKKSCNLQMRRAMLAIIILLSVNLIIFVADLNALKSLHLYNANIKMKITQSVSSNVGQKHIIKNSHYIDDLKKASLLENDSTKYSSIEFNEADIIISAITGNVEDYVRFVNLVESDGTFRIKDISSPAFSGSKIKFTIVISKK